MSDLKAYTIGQVVELKDGRTATVRFAGQTSFAAGDWVGVELEDASGKNDGSVQGQRFFDCKPGHGMFLRPTGVAQILEQSPTKPKQAAKTGTSTATAASTTARTRTTAGRPSVSNGAARPGGVDPTAKRRETMNAASPTPVRSAPPGHARTPSKLAPRTSTAGTTASRTSTVGATPRASATARAGAATSTPAATSRTPAARPAAAAAAARTGAATSTRTTATASKPSPSARPTPPRQSLVARAAAFPVRQTPAAGHAAKPSTTSATSSSSGPSPRKTGAAVAPSKPPTKATAPAVRKETKQGSGASSELDENPPDSGEEEEGEEDARTEKDGEHLSSPQTDTNGTDAGFEEEDDEERRPTPARRDEQRSLTASMRAASMTKPAARTNVSARQVTDLETKISLLEKSRNEDREQLKSLEKTRDKLQTERDRFESIIQKLQTKYQPQQQEMAELKKQLKDKEQKLTEVEDSRGGNDEDLEMAYLDKEMAEEIAENLKLELDQVKQKLEELQLEAEVLREENEELGKDVSPEERKQMSWLHLERENDRMREAIIRLRDMSMDTEAELKESIAAQEEELKELRALKDKHEEAREKQKQSDTIVDDLRQQLETALGAEDMLEELTEKNMALAEQVEDLKMNIKDLEDLRELNDELELNHVEAEKQMVEELDYKDSILAEQQRRAVDQEQKMVEREYAITKFRELVTNLQSDIEEMRSSQQITEAEAEELHGRSRAMAELNMKLQTSAAKTQQNTFDLELRRLEAQEAVEHLSIVQMFLPDSFQSERDSVLSYLRFKRVAAKARLLLSSIKDKLARTPVASGQDDVFALCDVVDKLVWISCACDRFSNNVSASSLGRFARYESALYELEPVERGLNVYIEALKRGDFKEEQTAEELARSISLLTHLAEVHIPEDDLEAFADDVLLRTTLIQSYLENTSMAFTFARNLIPSVEVDEGEEDSLETFKQQLDNIIGQSRSAKVVAGKTLSGLIELKDRSMALDRPRSDELIEQCQAAHQVLAATARQVGLALRNSLNDESDVETSPRSALRSAISQLAATLGESSSPIPAITSKLQIAVTQLNGVHGLASDLSVAVEFERSPPPWIQRAEELKSSKALSVSAEEEMQRLRDTIHERATQLRIRDQTLEEQSVKIELLESRTRDVNAKTNRITELQRLLEEGKGREKELEEAIDKKFHEIDGLMRDRDRWRQEAHTRKPSDEEMDTSKGDNSGGERAVATAREMDVLRAEIEGLQGAVRYLREDKERTGYEALENAWLHEPLVQAKTAAVGSASKREALRRQGNDLCSLLLDAMANAQLVDLTALPENKLEWRPARQKPAWKVARQSEAWQEWNANSVAFVGAASEELGIKTTWKRNDTWEDAREAVVV